jgi:hypothetical protein
MLLLLLSVLLAQLQENAVCEARGRYQQAGLAS